MDTVAGRVVTYGYHQTLNVSVELNNLYRVIIGIGITNSVVPPPPPASASRHQTEMDTVMEQSRLVNMLVVTLACVTLDLCLLADQEMNVLPRDTCVMEENLFVKIGLMWSFVTSTTVMFVLLTYS